MDKGDWMCDTVCWRLTGRRAMWKTGNVLPIMGEFESNVWVAWYTSQILEQAGGIQMHPKTVVGT